MKGELKNDSLFEFFGALVLLCHLIAEEPQKCSWITKNLSLSLVSLSR